jgi:hypothetical protein
MTGVTGATPEDGQWRRRVLMASDGSIRMGSWFAECSRPDFYKCRVPISEGFIKAGDGPIHILRS